MSTEENLYRVVDHPSGGFEPQMLYVSAATKGERVWHPIDAKGYWADPDSYTYGKARWRTIFDTRADAERAVTLAMAVNGDNLREAK